MSRKELTLTENKQVQAQLATAIKDIAIEATEIGLRKAPARDEVCMVNDPGEVNPAIMEAYIKLAADLGYRWNAIDMSAMEAEQGITAGEGCLMGFTVGWAPVEHLHEIGADLYTVNLRAGMSDASMARVTGHELGHAILGHPADNKMDAQIKTFEALIDKFTGQRDRAGNHAEELAVELATGAVCRVADIGTGDFSVMKTYSHLPHVTPETMPDVLNDALYTSRVLWAAIEDAA